jgi:crossover junction endodeoxyribonuclease RuvC
MGSRWRKQSTAQRFDGARVNRPTADHALVLGIDPGSAITGYAVVEVNARGDTSLVEAGALRLKRSETLTQRLAALASDMDALFQEHAFTHIAVETIFSHPSHVQSALQMGHARGVVLLAAARAHVELIELAPAEVKKAICGNGRATKEQMQQAVTMQCGLAKPPTPHDVADAIAIALTASRRLKPLA